MAKKTEMKKPAPNKKNCSLTPSGGCPFHNGAVISISIIVLLSYSAYLYDPVSFKSLSEEYSVLKPLIILCEAVEKYSPFHEYLDDDTTSKTTQETAKKDRLITPEELKEYDGSIPGKGPYLALLGHVFDVSKGKDHYGPGGGYSFFSGIDGSRAFVSGDFTPKGLHDDVTGLSSEDFLGLDDWIKFYRKDYIFVGKLIGRYYDFNGKDTPYSLKVKQWIAKAKKDADEKNAEKIMFPPCNSEWSENKHRVWCTTKSGGINRNWIGVPRKLFYPGRDERCACVKNVGPPTTDPAAKTNHGDLKSVHVKEYQDCPIDSASCTLNES